MSTLLNFIHDNLDMFYIVILSIFLGIEVISQVPSVLHTPLMSGANAIHGVIIIGAIIAIGETAPDNYPALIIGFLAVVVGTLNVVGGFVVTDRMLEMFKKRKPTTTKTSHNV
ncbi:pyridine nucleotide transhydrogenase-like protein [Mucilaginibacter gracilis]|uniref:proton-translocating NAD(P)(+) transhydrogenase n=1 Tax=Mucilaginibacter gracilis TaxID=423350 RepID=A0A495IWV1_9SPHI|nr:NAD(P) transhydrogenase subunit alpha [Mucilaginibacter gracilis]RKR80339.1 pyridine nucleotide transhydrogenase-like protein [Mucilaginibacter gracilis]